VCKSESGSARRAKLFIEQFLGGSAGQRMAIAKAASPMTYISKDDAAFLVIHGENDMSIPVSQSGAFVEALKAAGVDATLEVAIGRGHGVGGPRYKSVITDFFDKHLKANRAH
jgi:dipeptidyl aminopeptidase/acylaminoacyl peptidase